MHNADNTLDCHALKDDFHTIIRYNSIKILDGETISEDAARAAAVQVCVDKKCDFYFNVDSEVHLDNSKTLKVLIEQVNEISYVRF